MIAPLAWEDVGLHEHRDLKQPGDAPVPVGGGMDLQPARGDRVQFVIRNPGMALIAVLVREDRPMAFAARIATATVLARSRNLRRAARGPRPCGPSSGGMHAMKANGLGP